MKIKFFGALALVVSMGLMTANAGMKQMEIKGGIELLGYAISYDSGVDAFRGGGSDSLATLLADLDFKMKFSQDVSARIDLEMDGATAGDRTFKGKTITTAANDVGDRYGFGIDQAYFKMNDFLFKNFSLSVGKQNLNFSLRDNGSYSWAYTDPISVLGVYSTRDVDVNFYFAKVSEGSDLGASASAATPLATNDADVDIIGSYLEYWLNDDSLFIGYLNFASNDVTKTNIFHYGLGLDYYIGESLEIYGEAAGQSVDMGASDGSAFQLNLGAEYAFTDFDMKPTLNFDYYLQSGAEVGTSADPAWQNIAGGAKGAENQSIFVEGSANNTDARSVNFGVGIGAVEAGTGGYQVWRLNGWLSPSKTTKVGLGIHVFADEDDAAGTKDDLGMEIDLTGSWKYSQDVSFIAGAFLWTGAESDGSGGIPVGAGSEFEDVDGLMIGSVLSF